MCCDMMAPSVPIIKPHRKPNLRSELCLINMESENGKLAYMIQGANTFQRIVFNIPISTIYHV